MKNLLLLSVVLLSFNSFSQSKWENGKIQFENGTSLECLIKNENWSDNPKSIVYQKQGETESIAELRDLKAFEIFNDSKYIKATVDIENSPSKINDLTYTRKANFDNKVVLLKLLVDGKADLLEYENNGKIQYLYRVDENNIKPLIYKIYRNQDNLVLKNKDFIYQLNTDVSCGEEKLAMNSIDYNQKDLLNYFNQYNSCTNSQSISYIKNNKAKLEINFLASMVFMNSRLNSGTDYDNTNLTSNEISFRAGVQAELYLPVKRKNISLFSELSYITYSPEFQEFVEPNFIWTSSFKINKIDVMFGGKYYFYVNDHSKIYAEAMYNFFSINTGKNEVISVLTTEESSEIIRTNQAKIKNLGYLGFGLGFKYKERYRLGARINTMQNTTKSSGIYNNQNYEFNIVAGYTLF